MKEEHCAYKLIKMLMKCFICINTTYFRIEIQSVIQFIFDDKIILFLALFDGTKTINKIYNIPNRYLSKCVQNL